MAPPAASTSELIDREESVSRQEDPSRRTDRGVDWTTADKYFSCSTE